MSLIQENPPIKGSLSSFAGWVANLPADGKWYRHPEPQALGNMATAVRAGVEVTTRTVDAEGKRAPGNRKWFYCRKAAHQ